MKPKPGPIAFGSSKSNWMNPSRRLHDLVGPRNPGGTFTRRLADHSRSARRGVVVHSPRSSLIKRHYPLEKTESCRSGGFRLAVQPGLRFRWVVAGLHSEMVVIPFDGFVMKSNSISARIWTIEKIWLPHRSRLGARVEGKSSLARLGIGVHVTAPTILAGFGYKKDDENYPGSPLQLEIWNVGPLDVETRSRKPICQLIFEIVDGTPEKGYAGRFSIQGPTIPPTS